MTYQARTIDVEGSGLAYLDSGDRESTILFLHGISMSSKTFIRQFEGALPDRYRLLALDLPGHGASANALDADAVYTIPGYAKVVRKFLDAMNIQSVVLVGFSLGGNIAMELAATDPRGIAAIMAVGAVPLPADPARIVDGIVLTPDAQLLYQSELDEGEREKVAAFVFDGIDPVPKFLLDDIRRADGRMRARIGETAFAGQYADQQAFLAATDLPVGLVYGAEDRLIRVDYVRGVTGPSLWRNGVATIDGCGHVPPWQTPEAFNELLSSFADDTLS